MLTGISHSMQYPWLLEGCAGRSCSLTNSRLPVSILCTSSLPRQDKDPSAQVNTLPLRPRPNRSGHRAASPACHGEREVTGTEEAAAFLWVCLPEQERNREGQRPGKQGD